MSSVANGAVAVAVDESVGSEPKHDAILPMVRRDSYKEALKVTVPDSKSNESVHPPAAPSGWRRLLPFIPGKPRGGGGKYPMLTSGWLSLISFHWTTALLLKGFRAPLQVTDLWNIHPLDSAEATGVTLKREWLGEIQKANGDVSKAKLGRAFFSAFGRSIVFACLSMLVYQALQFVSAAIFVFQLVNYVEIPAENSTLSDGLTIAFTFLINEILRSFAFSVHWFFALKAAFRFRASLNMVVFDKVMHLRNLGKMTVGQVVNLCVNDGHRLFECALFAAFMVGAPAMTVAVITYTTITIGWPAILGCLTFFVFYPIQVAFGKRIGLYRRLAVHSTDVRVRKMNEILNFVKLIKMYAWEGAFARQIASIRAKERVHLERSQYFTAMTFALTPIVPVLATAITFTAKTLTGGSLTTSEAYSVLASFTAMRFSLAVLPFGVRALSEANVAMPRLKALLEMPERIPIGTAMLDSGNSIELSSATFAWDARESAEKDDGRGKIKKAEHRQSTMPAIDSKEDDLQEVPDCLVDLTLSVQKGELIGVCGAFGSGKSSLISALLGGMNIRSGSIALQGGVAYVSQQAWIINASVQENILFGNKFDKERYQRVLAASALSQDLEVLPDGDLTEIGERGINLSGGQKQRVSLARALYVQRDVYLLDDPLSAVDAHVGAHIFSELIKKELAGKTVLLVTHQLQYLQSCDRVVMMVGGRIAEKGTYSALLAAEGEFHLLMKQYLEEEEGDGDDDEENREKEEISKVLEVLKNATDVESIQRQISVMSSGSTGGQEPGDNHLPSPSARRRKKKRKNKVEEGKSKTHGGPPMKLVEMEDRNVGSVKWPTYLAFIKAAGGISVAIFLLFLTMLTVVSNVMTNWWVSQWLEDGDGNSTNATGASGRQESEDISLNPRLTFFVGVLYALVGAVALTSITRGLLFVKASLYASSNLHNHVFKRVFRAPMHFFDTTPTGRILNRFSKDLDEIDTQLPWLLSNSVLNSLVLIGAVAVATVIYPILLAPIAAVAVVFFVIQMIYVKAIRELKRLDNISRSPLISHLGSSIQGIATIHAFNKTEEFTQTFRSHMDQNTVCLQGFQGGARWIALRLDLLSTIVIFCTGLLLVLTKGSVAPALAGLAITYIVQIGGLLQFTVRSISETQSRFTSVERINHYATEIPVEAPEHIEETRPSESWPGSGQVTFHNVQMRYREGSPLVLHGLSFNVKGQEKIGVIGRTGAGKSSLAVCLLRLVEIEAGTIFIDNVDISTLGLTDLRSRLSIIPQDPVLFVGSIRYNLDPFNTHSDTELNHALEQTHLQGTIAALPDGLQTEVVENGENFSVGERQLICMARALLRHSKILILDEATASIDTETDALIQRTIRDCFADCTLLTIAHRLNTILDSDRLLVMDEGRVAEFDTPAKLLANPDSAFTKLLAASRQSHEE